MPLPTNGDIHAYGALLKSAEERLSAVTENAEREAWFLFSQVFAMDKAAYYLKRREIAEPQAAKRFEDLLARRLEGEPLQYLLGQWEFYGLPFLVWPGVLIPRPETELLVDIALEAVKEIKAPRVLDLCCGSGCIAVAIARRRPDAAVTAVDGYPEPLQCTQENAARNEVKLQIMKADVLRRPDIRFEKYDLIVSNPPYIREGELKKLQKELRYEPSAALNGGADGLRFYREIIGGWKGRLAPGGKVALEIGFDQREQVTNLLSQHGFERIICRQDLGGQDRVLFGHTR